MSNSEAYRIVRQIGNGLTGPVFLADVASGRAAIRQFQSGAEAGSEAWLADLQHFLQGGAQAARLHHSCIVETLEVIDESQDAYIAVEYVAAETCETIMARETLTRERVNHLLRLMAVALDYAHQNGVTHGDLKPSNIFVLPTWAIKIADFVISPRARRHAGPVPHDLYHPYLSPEHLSAPETIGPRSDQYAMAAIARRFYAGASLLAEARPADVRIKTATENFHEPKKPARAPAAATHIRIPPAAEAALSRALSSDPAARYASCLQFVDALEAGFAPPPPEVIERKSPKLIYVAAGGIAGLLLLLAFLLSASSRSENPRPSGTKKALPPVSGTAAGSAAVAQEPPPKRPSPTGPPVHPAGRKEVRGDPPRQEARADVSTPPPVPVRKDPLPGNSPPSRAAANPEAVPNPPQARNMEIVLLSRNKKIEPGISFSSRDQDLGEMADGDLTAVVQMAGPPPKGRLTLEWILNDVPMGARQPVIPNRAIQYGNEPTPGTYRVELRLDGAVVKSSNFRITK